MKPIPTVDQLEAIFKERGWEPVVGTAGATQAGVAQGKCCAIPAVIAYYDPEFNFTDPKNDNLYKCAKNFGVHTVPLWSAFDGSKREDRFEDEAIKWFRLGRELRKRLLG